MTFDNGPTINGERLLARLDQLATISAPGPGVTRQAYSPEDVAARELLAGWMEQAGLRTEVDAAGSLIGRLPGTEGLPGTLAIGSHQDTVVSAGPLDGAYGVVASIEVAAALREAGSKLRHDLAVIAFSNEEGARGTPGMVGSLAITGQITEEHLAGTDDEGVTLADRIAAGGGDPTRITSAAWPAGSLAGFLELHVEQGPVLDEAGIPIAVVSGITGRMWVDLLVTGAANHAGTTPMSMRRDAAQAAARLVLAVPELAGDDGVRVATAGVVRLEPGVRNVVAGHALVGVDIRDMDEGRIAAAVERLRAVSATIAAETGTAIEVAPRSSIPAVPSDPRLADCVRDAATGLDLAHLELPSGAGHDAQVMGVLGPVGMAFTPSRAGISHAPSETTNPEDLVAGVQVLSCALQLADARLSAGESR